MVGGERQHGKQSRQPERSTETAAQTELVGQIVRQQPDEDDTETATYKVGQPSDNQVTDQTRSWSRDGREHGQDARPRRAAESTGETRAETLD